MDYQIAPILDNEAERLAVLRSAMCAYVPREERFDRITRMAQRMLHVPIALVSVIEDDVQWFRSAQGLTVPETARSISFCGHAIEFNEVFQVPDTHLDPRFARNPLVTGPPYIRSYCGWPLELAPGLRVGALCVIDTMPRTFAPDDLEILSDLAHMAASELRINAMSDSQKSLLVESSRAHRKLLLNPTTGCWSERGFGELIKRTLRAVVAGEVHGALCGMHILNIEDFNLGQGEAALEARPLLVSQFIRQRMPANAVLCRLPGARICALFAMRDKSLLDEQIDIFLRLPAAQPLAGINLTQKLEISSAGLWLKPEHLDDDPGKLLDTVMGQLAEDASLSAMLH
jgi:GAF domain